MFVQIILIFLILALQLSAFDIRIEYVGDKLMRFTLITNVTLFYCQGKYYPTAADDLINEKDNSMEFELTEKLVTLSLFHLQPLTNYQMETNCSVNYYNFSNETIIFTNWTTLPARPDPPYLSDPCSNTSCEIFWNDANDLPKHLVDHYEVIWNSFSPSDWRESANFSNSPAILTDLKPGSIYMISFRVWTTLGLFSDWSDSLIIQTHTNSPPRKPIYVIISQFNATTATVIWNRPLQSSLNFNIINSYSVNLYTNDGTMQMSLEVSETWATFYNLPACTRMKASVGARNNHGLSEATFSSTAFFLPKLPILQAPVVVYSNATLQIVKWEEISVAPCNYYYFLHIVNCHIDKDTTIIKTTTNSANVTNLLPMQWYRYKVLPVVESLVYSWSISSKCFEVKNVGSQIVKISSNLLLACPLLLLLIAAIDFLLF